MAEPNVERLIREYVVQKFSAFLTRAVSEGIIDRSTSTRLFELRVSEWRAQWREEDKLDAAVIEHERTQDQAEDR